MIVWIEILKQNVSNEYFWLFLVVHMGSLDTKYPNRTKSPPKLSLLLNSLYKRRKVDPLQLRPGRRVPAPGGDSFSLNRSFSLCFAVVSFTLSALIVCSGSGRLHRSSFLQERSGLDKS